MMGPPVKCYGLRIIFTQGVLFGAPRQARPHWFPLRESCRTTRPYMTTRGEVVFAGEREVPDTRTWACADHIGAATVTCNGSMFRAFSTVVLSQSTCSSIGGVASLRACLAADNA